MALRAGFCDGWFASGGGHLKILLHADKPYLDNPSFAEQAISFFVAGTLTNYLDNIIRKEQVQDEDKKL